MDTEGGRGALKAGQNRATARTKPAARIAAILAVGWKEGNRLLIGGEEFLL